MSSAATFICNTKMYNGWSDIMDCTDPNSWAYFGIAIALTFSIMGASG